MAANGSRPPRTLAVLSGVLLLASCGTLQENVPAVGPSPTASSLPCRGVELATREVDEEIHITFEPADPDQKPAVSQEAACQTAEGYGGAQATSAEATFGLLTWPEAFGGLERLPVWRVVFNEACLPYFGGSPPPGTKEDSPRAGCAPTNHREAVLINASTGDFIASYGSGDLG